MAARRVAAAAVATAALAASAAFAVACSSDDERLDELIAEMDARVPELLAEFDVPGVAIAVVVDGEVVWSAGYGYADVASEQPVGDSTVFQVASISKSVTAWSVMRLVDEGTVSLDALVERYLTRWELPASEFDSTGVTPRRLLSHTAGLSLSGYPGFEPDATLPSLEESVDGETNGAGAVELVAGPGSEYRYSGGGFTVLQLMIEEASGRGFVEYMQETVLEPLGMDSSSFAWLPELQSRTATAYDLNNQPLPNYLYTAKAAAGLYATALDLGRFVAATMPGPRGEERGRDVVLVASVFEMLTPGMGAYGLGHGAIQLDESLRIGHSGANRGWRSVWAALPDGAAGIVILSNSDRADSTATSDHFIARLTCIWGAWTEIDAFPECPEVSS